MKVSKSGLIMLIIGLLAVGFASVSTTLILTGTVSVGVNKDDFEVVFASANIEGGHANISKTTKKGDTLTFSTPDISKVDEPVVLNYTVKNNSTQYGAEVSIKCYAVNDTNHYLNDYITLTGVFGTQNITFGVDEASATLSEAKTINAQGILNGSITVNLDKPFLENDGHLSVACKIVANASEQTSAGVRPDNPLVNNTEIESISGNSSPFTKVTGKNYDYELGVDEGTTEVILDVKTKNLYSDVYVGKVEDTSTLSSASDNYQVNLLGVSLLTGSNIEYTKNLTVKLNGKINYFKIKVVSEDGTEEAVYTIKIRVLKIRLLNRAIREDNPLVTSTPTLTSTSSATNENGLYSSTETNSGEPTYYFRGNVTSNYINFAGFNWRIVRINEDGTIRIIMEDRIFNNHDNNYSIRMTWWASDGNPQNGYYSCGGVDYVAISYLNNWYTKNITNKNYASHVASGNYFCEQAKIKQLSTDADTVKNLGSANMTWVNEYVPNFKCELDGNNKGPINSNIGIISYDELVHAGYSYTSENTSIYLHKPYTWWSINSAGADYYSYGLHWVVLNTGKLAAKASKDSTFVVRAVINLNADTTVTGSGTSDDPYTIE